MRLSIIIPTHNRPEKLSRLLGCLGQQDLSPDEYEIVVVDDNSAPPVVLKATAGPRVNLLRLDETERSAARNAGAALASGELLVFLDDDMTVESDFLACHLSAHESWPSSLVVGSIRLPMKESATPFECFRQRLEDQGLPQEAGPASMPNLCTAANMSLARKEFAGIGGFDPSIISGEDQDLALRHTARGGRIVFWPVARAIHWDSSLDIRTYCERSEWGSKHLLPFCRRYPDWPDNIERDRVNGPLRLGRESPKQSLRKIVKSALAVKPVREILFFVARRMERAMPKRSALERIYKLLLGAHIFRGYRAGLIRYASDEIHLSNQTEMNNSNLIGDSPVKN